MIKCHRCGKELNLPYINPYDGIFTYCDFCWNQVIGELKNGWDSNEVQSNS